METSLFPIRFDFDIETFEKSLSRNYHISEYLGMLFFNSIYPIFHYNL